MKRFMSKNEWSGEEITDHNLSIVKAWAQDEAKENALDDQCPDSDKHIVIFEAVAVVRAEVREIKTTTEDLAWEDEDEDPRPSVRSEESC